MKREEFKTVEMTRQIRDQMYEETKDLGQEEFLRYVRQRSAAASAKVEERDELVATQRLRTTHR
jgi:hypothetical protein